MNETASKSTYKASVDYHSYHIARLKDPEYASVYLEVHLEDHEPLDIDTNLLKLALSNVAEALAPEQLSTHLQDLETILQKKGAEAIYGLADWLKGFGLKLTVTVAVAETNTEDNTWDFKEIQVTAENAQISNQLKSRIIALEEELVRLRQELDGVKSGDAGSFTFSSLLDTWIKEETNRLNSTREIVITTLCNQLGLGACSPEIEDLIGSPYPMVRNKYQHYVMWIADLKILRKKDGTPYISKELLDLPSGIELT